MRGVHLDDLGAPRFCEQARQVLDAMAAMAGAWPLEPAAMMDAAMTDTGLSDFGDPAFGEPLALLCASLRDEAGLSPYGQTGLYVQFVQLLKNRLRIEDLLGRHPEIRAIPITAPIVIAGLPRTGTTHLHNLIAAPLTWRCADGHVFGGSPRLILTAGHWCPECVRTPADYARQATANRFLAQVEK